MTSKVLSGAFPGEAAPDVLVCLGDTAVQALLGQRDGILRARGKPYEYAYGSRTVPALATLNPDFQRIALIVIALLELDGKQMWCSTIFSRLL